MKSIMKYAADPAQRIFSVQCPLSVESVHLSVWNSACTADLSNHKLGARMVYSLKGPLHQKKETSSHATKSS
jgi:hypothetical protein